MAPPYRDEPRRRNGGHDFGDAALDTDKASQLVLGKGPGAAALGARLGGGDNLLMERGNFDRPFGFATAMDRTCPDPVS